MIKALVKKLNNKNGETLVESLAGLIVIVLAVVILAGAIVSAAKVNNKVKNTDTNFEGGGTVVEAGTDDGKDIIKLKHTTTGKEDTQIYSSTSKYVTEYKTDNGYYYYKVNE